MTLKHQQHTSAATNCLTVRKHADTQVNADRPITCDLSMTDLRTRRGDLLPSLMSAAVECLEIPNGYRLHFRGAKGTLAHILRVVQQERQCCRFLHFSLILEPDLGPIWLDVRGPSGTPEFLRSVLRL
jgi:hypothetical protein